MATKKSTPLPRRLMRWTMTVVLLVVLLAAAMWVFRYAQPYLPGTADMQAEKRAAMELCWQEQGTVKPGMRIEGGACDRLDKLFMPKITEDAYGVYVAGANPAQR